MRSVRVLVQNMKPGDVFVSHGSDDRVVIVERPVRNMGKQAKRNARKRLYRPLPAKEYPKIFQPEPQVATVDKIMSDIGYGGFQP